MFKIFNGYENIDINMLFSAKETEGLEDMKLH